MGMLYDHLYNVENQCINIVGQPRRLSLLDSCGKLNWWRGIAFLCPRRAFVVGLPTLNQNTFI